MESLSDLVEFALLGLEGGQICEILLLMMLEGLIYTKNRDAKVVEYLFNSFSNFKHFGVTTVTGNKCITFP